MDIRGEKKNGKIANRFLQVFCDFSLISMVLATLGFTKPYQIRSIDNF